MCRISTLEQFKDLINGTDEWRLSFNEAIRENGWQDLTGTPYGICSDGRRKIVLDEYGKAEIVEIC